MNFKDWVFDEKIAIVGVTRYAGPLLRKLLPRNTGFHRR